MGEKHKRIREDFFKSIAINYPNKYRNIEKDFFKIDVIYAKDKIATLFC
jgi:hypothetical protein